MKYVQYINGILNYNFRTNDGAVAYGQNIDAGSCLSGLTKGIADSNHGLTINTPNIENTLAGIGFGLFLNGVNSVLFMKQFDFLLLGVDHLVNTYNIVRQEKPKASFTIFPITVDSGYEGPQAALNNFDDFCSLAGIEGYSFTNSVDTKAIMDNHLFKPGFRILSTGQRLLKLETIDVKAIYSEPNQIFFKYAEGKSASIVCFNHSLPLGLKLNKILLKKGAGASLFSINSHLHSRYEKIYKDIAVTKKLVVIDDSKSKNRVSEKFISEARKYCELDFCSFIVHKEERDMFFPRSDEIHINYEELSKNIL